MFERMTTDTPESNMENVLNRFYMNSDRWVMVRGGGEDPKFPNVSLTNYVKRLAAHHNADINLNGDDFDISEEMTDTLYDGPDTIEGLIADLYAAAVAAATLREKLRRYENEEEAGRLLHLPYSFGEEVYTYDFFGIVEKGRLLRVEVRDGWEKFSEVQYVFVGDSGSMYQIAASKLDSRIFKTYEDAELHAHS